MMEDNKVMYNCGRKCKERLVIMFKPQRYVHCRPYVVVHCYGIPLPSFLAGPHLFERGAVVTAIQQHAAAATSGNS